MSKKKFQDHESAPMFETPGGSDQTEVTPAVIPTTNSMVADVDASDVVGNSECIFTKGCRGRIYTYNTVRVPVQDGDRQFVETRQQLRCNSCGKVARGHRVVGVPGGRRLFDRRARS
ncbi:MAG: hypothetical protein JNL58_04410 [Planctomyces sp.]|nr:hypothetical protein [Planctomyces sp.]